MWHVSNRDFKMQTFCSWLYDKLQLFHNDILNYVFKKCNKKSLHRQFSNLFDNGIPKDIILPFWGLSWRLQKKCCWLLQSGQPICFVALKAIVVSISCVFFKPLIQLVCTMYIWKPFFIMVFLNCVHGY